MAKVDMEDVKRVRARVDIVRIVSRTVPIRHGVDGSLGKGECPWCRGPLYVSSKRGFFYCDGCRECGNVIDWVMKAHDQTFAAAVALLTCDAALEVES